MAKSRQRGTGVRIRSEAKAAAADRLLLAAQDAGTMADLCRDSLKVMPVWRFQNRRKLRRQYLLSLERYMQAVRSAQDIARKGRHVEL